MSIKKLQSNFTTPEQSKRLLELGVPADSADCIYPCYKQEGESDEQIMYGHINIKHPAGSHPKCFIPCWSVGRLMEIFEICDNLPSFTRADMCSIPSLKRMSYMEYMMKCYNKAIEMGFLDFSKLEE